MMTYIYEKGQVPDRALLEQLLQGRASEQSEGNMKTIAECLRDEGRQEGEQIGERQNSLVIALRLLKEGYQLDFIAKITQLKPKEIKQLSAKAVVSDC